MVGKQIFDWHRFFNGAFFKRLKSRGFSRFNRIYRPTKPSGAANKNGIRHPQVCTKSASIKAVIAAAISEPSNRPVAVLAGTILV